MEDINLVMMKPSEPKNEIKVPKAVKGVLKDLGGENEEVLALAPTDMNEDGEYADGYTVLTEKALYVLKSEPEKNAVHSFKGFLNRKDRETEKERDWKCTRFPVEDIKKITVEPQVACGILVAEFSDGIERTVAVFSNLYRKEVHVLSRAFANTFEKHEEGEEGKEGKEGKGRGGKGGRGPGGPGGLGGNDDDIYCPRCGMMYPKPERKICPRCMDRRSVFVRTFGYFRPYAGKMVIMMLIYVAVAALNLVWPYLNGTVLYDYILKKNGDFLPKIGILNGDYVLALLLVILTMFAARLTVQILTVIQGVFTAHIVSYVVRDIKKDIFKAMGKLSISFFRNRQTGGLMTRVLRDADRVTGFFIDGFPYIFIHSFSLIATLVMMFSINWKMTVCALILMPGAFVFMFFMRPKMWTAFGHRHRAERTLNSRVNDNLTGARVVKSFGQEAREEERFISVNKRLKDSEMSIVSVSNFLYFTFNFAHSISSIVIWIMGVYMILVERNMQVGVMITFIGYVDQLNGPMNFASRVFRWWSDSMNAAQRMFEIIDAIPEIREEDKPLSMKEPRGEIELKNVTFGYEINRPVLKDLNLKIPAGSMLGIVGRSGAGKTTLVNLISRMYDPQEGSILIDGVDIKKLSFRDLRRNVAMVSQETYIFMGTVEENIAYANPDATKQEIIRAAKLASAHEFILRMPDGYNTIVGSSGRELSGGERQRISIARAILANPKILILDEATASVDTETERAIQAAINYLVKNRTTISIAHRLSTLRDADFLCVIDNGEITERGTHKELEALHGTYYKLMELQTKALALKE